MVSPLRPAAPIAPRDSRPLRAALAPPFPAPSDDEVNSPKAAASPGPSTARPATGGSAFAAHLFGQAAGRNIRAEEAAGAYRLQDAADAPVRRFLNI